MRSSTLVGDMSGSNANPASTQAILAGYPDFPGGASAASAAFGAGQRHSLHAMGGVAWQFITARCSSSPTPARLRLADLTILRPINLSEGIPQRIHLQRLSAVERFREDVYHSLTISLSKSRILLFSDLLAKEERGPLGHGVVCVGRCRSCLKIHW